MVACLKEAHAEAEGFPQQVEIQGLSELPVFFACNR